MTELGFLVLDQSRVPAGDGWLTSAERRWLGGRRSAKRIEDWRRGRWTAKRAVRTFLSRSGADLPRRVEILADDDGAPIARADGEILPLSLSLSHAGDRALCVVAAPGVVVGGDLERIEPRSRAFVADYLTAAERAELAASTVADLHVNLIWSGKESALKALRCGLRADTRSVEVTVDHCPDNGWGSFTVTSPLARGAFRGHWCRLGDLVMTLVSRPTGVPVDLEEAAARPRRS